MQGQPCAGQRTADRTIKMRIYNDRHVAGKRQRPVPLLPSEFADQDSGQRQRQGLRFMLPPADRTGRERAVQDA